MLRLDAIPTALLGDCGRGAVVRTLDLLLPTRTAPPPAQKPHADRSMGVSEKCFAQTGATSDLTQSIYTTGCISDSARNEWPALCTPALRPEPG